MVIGRFGGPDVLREQNEEVPSAGIDELSIDVAYAGLNFADVLLRRGNLPGVSTPVVPGMEVSGRVREVGENVRGFRRGDPVCARTGIGGYAEVAVAAAVAVHHLPADDDASLRVGAALPVAASTAWGLVHDVARVRQGETVLISAAAGGVGTLAAQLARSAGAGAVYGVASSAHKAQYAAGFGYDRVFVDGSWASELSEALAGEGIDVVLDSVGGAFRERAHACLAPLGRLIIFGNAGGEPEQAFDAAADRAANRSVLGFSMSGLSRLAPHRARGMRSAAVSAASRRDVRVEVTRVIPLEDAASAHAAMEARETTGKVLLAVGAVA